MSINAQFTLTLTSTAKTQASHRELLRHLRNDKKEKNYIKEGKGTQTK